MEGGGSDELLELDCAVNNGVKGGDHVGALAERDARRDSRGGEEGHVYEAAAAVVVVVGMLPSAQEGT